MDAEFIETIYADMWGQMLVYLRTRSAITPHEEAKASFDDTVAFMTELERKAFENG